MQTFNTAAVEETVKKKGFWPLWGPVAKLCRLLWASHKRFASVSLFGIRPLVDSVEVWFTEKLTNDRIRLSYVVV